MNSNFSYEMEGDMLVGPVRAPINSVSHHKGSIHDDSTAQKLGFRGGKG